MNNLSRLARSVQTTSGATSAFRAIHPRHFCTTPVAADGTPADADGAAPPPRKAKKVRQPDSPHVVRRTAYLREMSRARIAFADEGRARAEEAAASAAAARDTSTEASAARAEAKAAKSEAHFARVLEEREVQKEKSAKKRAAGLEAWKAKNLEIDARRRGRVDVLNAVADDWVTEANLERKIEELLDEWFVNSDAEAHARRGTPETREYRGHGRG